MKKTFILNEKTAKCKTCKHFHRVRPEIVGKIGSSEGHCDVHGSLLAFPKVFPDDYCDLHSDLVDTSKVRVDFTAGLSPEERAHIKGRINDLFARGYRGRSLT